MKKLRVILWTYALACLCAVNANGQDVGTLASQKPFVINGTLGIGLGTYTNSGIADRERNFSYLINGAPVISIYGVSFPFSVVVSDQQRGFRQPFDQYGISPQYKWITVHAGWQSISWSPYSMAGYNFLGGGIELTPGILRLGFVYGRFNKAVDIDPTQPTLFQTPAYLRTGYSLRAGLGTERNHFDLVFLNAKDDPTSLSNPTTTADLHPAENMVLGISSRFTIRKHLTWSIDAAASAYTRNRVADTLENLELDKFDFVKKLITINASTQLLTAGQTELTYQNHNYHVGVQYKRIDPDYKSMGAYYFETDVANYTFNGGITLFKNLLQLNGSFGLQNDNLLHDKPFTSKRSITSLNAAYNKPNYGFNLAFSNYGITQDRGLNPIIDTFRVARTNYNVNALVRYTISGSNTNQNFVLAGNLQSLVDLNHFTAAQSETNSKTINASYQVDLSKKALSITTNVNYTTADITAAHTVFWGPSVGVTKTIGKNVASVNALLAYQQQYNNGQSNGGIINATLGANARVNKRDGMALSVSYLKSNSTDVTLPSFNELRSSLTITHTF